MSDQTGPPRTTAPAGPPAAAATLPHGVGPYTDLAPHARGGLGEVLKAADPALRRTVAVKRLHDRHADNPASRRRFLLEAEVTARLEHPGVVPVYGLHADADGRPCYAMRFVQGPTLADAIAAHHAGPPDPVAFRRLLQSFLGVCQTVAYAHSQGVIHRDLKPQNVMVGPFGEALVVDWGLAKVVGDPAAAPDPDPDATRDEAPAGPADETALGSAVGTPAYMSPEQAAGRWDVIRPASDVYGLGAVLYTILTGRPPLAGGNWPELLQKIQRGDFPRPRAVNPAAPPALEAVCLKAMAADPPARYPSASALAADLERWLAGEPVTAWPEPFRVRAGRWVRRNKTVVAAAAVILVTALVAAAVGLAVLGRKNREVADERNAARTAAAEAEAVNDFLTHDLLGQADPDSNDRDKKVTVEELLGKAAGSIDGNPKFADRPEVEASLRLTIGKTYFKLGNLPEAEGHLRRAVALRRAALPPDDPRTLAAQEALADFLNRGPGRFAEAEGLARATWDARSRALGPDHRDTLDSLDTYATSLTELGKRAEAMARYRECLAARRRALGDDHPDTLVSMGNLASLLVELGGWAEAIPLLREVLAAHGRAGVRETDHTTGVSNLALALYLKGDLEEADRLLVESIDRAARRLGPGHLETDRLRGLQVRVWTDQGKVTEAVALARQVAARRRDALPAGHPLIAMALLDLGRGLARLGRHAEAEAALAEALRVFDRSPPAVPHMAAWAECWHGAALAGLGRPAEAEPRLLSAERKLRDAPSAPRRHHREAVEQVVKLYDGWKRPADADRWRKELAALDAGPAR